MKNKAVLIKYIIVIFSAPVIGLLLLLFVSLLPTAKMKEHIFWSLEMLEKEFNDELIIDGYRPTLTGNFTDCIMLEHAVYRSPDHSLLEQVLMMYRAESYYVPEDPDGWHPGESLVDYLCGYEQPREVEYARYWHGYLVFLEPLLLLTSVNSLRLLFGSTQLVLAGICIYLMSQKKQKRLALAFSASLPFLFFISTFSSLSLSICLYVAFVSLIILLLFGEKMEQKHTLGLAMMIIGMATSYFDFLTYPLICLCFPLVALLYYQESNWKHNIKKCLLYSASWSFGYLWMWASKWLMTDIFTDHSTIKDALSTVFIRTGSAEGFSKISGFLKVLSLNLGPYKSLSFLCIGALMLAIAVILFINNKSDLKRIKNNIPVFAVILFTAVYPFCWWFLTQNHSEQHWIYTCRIFGAFIFSFFAALFRLTEKE